MKPTATIGQWEQFCDGIKEAGRDILATAGDADESTHAEGLRYLTRLLRSAIERQVEYSDPLDPFMAPTRNERLRWGLDNPDSIYLMTAVDGRHEYELSGNVGTVPYFSLTSAETGLDSRQVTTGYLDGNAVKTDKAGNFTIRIGGSERAENWLRLAPGSSSVLLRQTFRNRAEEQGISCRIRLVSDTEPDQLMNVEDSVRRVQKAGGFFLNTGRTFLNLAGILAQNVNGLPAVDEKLKDKLGGDPSYSFYWSAFQVEPDQALLIHLPEVPECESWALCLYNHWLESLDYTRAKINLNKYTSAANPDGSVTIVIAHQLPDGGNWLDTCNHVHGNMMFRWINAKQTVAPQTALVQFDEIDWPRVLRRWHS